MPISKSRYQEFQYWQAQVIAAADTFVRLHTADAAVADKEVSDNMLSVFLPMVTGANAFLNASFSGKCVIEAGLAKPVKHSDAMLLVGALSAALEALKSQVVQFKHNRWYWPLVVDGSPGQIEYVPVEVQIPPET